jgi:hypothetical protein
MKLLLVHCRGKAVFPASRHLWAAMGAELAAPTDRALVAEPNAAHRWKCDAYNELRSMQSTSC